RWKSHSSKPLFPRPRLSCQVGAIQHRERAASRLQIRHDWPAVAARTPVSRRLGTGGYAEHGSAHNAVKMRRKWRRIPPRACRIAQRRALSTLLAITNSIGTPGPRGESRASTSARKSAHCGPGTLASARREEGAALAVDSTKSFADEKPAVRRTV